MFTGLEVGRLSALLRVPTATTPYQHWRERTTSYASVNSSSQTGSSLLLIVFVVDSWAPASPFSWNEWPVAPTRTTAYGSDLPMTAAAVNGGGKDGAGWCAAVRRWHRKAG